MSTAQSGSAISPFHRFPVIIGNIRIPLFFKFTQNPNSLKLSMTKEFNSTKTIGGYVFEHWGKKPMTLTGKVLIKKDSSLGNFIGLNTKTTNFGIDDAVFSPEVQTLKTLFNIDQRKIKSSLLPDGSDSVLSNVITAAVAGSAILSNPVTTVGALASGVTAGLEHLKLGGSTPKFKEPQQADLAGYLSTITDTIILYKGVIYSGFFTQMDITEDGSKPFYNEVNFKFLVTNTTNDWIDTSLTQTAVGRTLSTLMGTATSITTIGSLLSDLFKDTGSDTNGHI